MRKLFLILLALYMTTGIPLVQAADEGGEKPKEEEKEPECD